MAQSHRNDYWATVPTDEIGDNLVERANAFYKHLQNYGWIDRYSRSYRYYYAGTQLSASTVLAGGDQGELSICYTNHYHNILRHIQTMTISERPAFEPRATNNDVKSQKNTNLARSLLDYYLKEKKIERDLEQAVRFATVFGEGFIDCSWDASAGKSYIKQDGNPADPNTPGEALDIKEGDFKVYAHEPINVIRDCRLDQFRNRDWLILRTYENKWNLAERYPQFKKDIVSIDPNSISVIKTTYRNQLVDLTESDQIPLFVFYHAPTPSCPNGRLTKFLENGKVLVDAPYPYKRMYTFRLAFEEQVGSPMGYTVGFDLLPLQESYDSTFSTVLTNQETFGLQNIIAPLGCGLAPSDVQGGLNMIYYNPDAGKPEILQLLSTPPEMFTMLDLVETNMEKVSNVNGVARGDPKASVGTDPSGAAMALVQGLSIQSNSQFQGNYTQCLEDVGSAIIEILQEFAVAPRIAQIVGKDQRSEVKEFNKDDLVGVQRVTVEAGNPMAKTIQGKMAIAQMLLQAGVKMEVQQLLQVLSTGLLEPMVQASVKELENIKSENETMADGQPALAVVTDSHILHITEHASVLSDPMARQDPAAIQAVQEHMLQHITLLSDPNNAILLQILGQPALPPQQGGAPSMGGPPQAPGAQNMNAQIAEMQPSQPKLPGKLMQGQPDAITPGAVPPGVQQ